MATLKLNLAGGAVRYVDDAATVVTPDGPEVAGDLSPGDLIALFSDGHMPVEITSIETE